MSRYKWSKLNKQQLGTYFEYFMKMVFTMFGFEVYTSEVDDRGIDFIARTDKGVFLEIQAKCVRNYNYVFMKKAHFAPKEGLYVALGLLVDDQEPLSYLIPSEAWLTPGPIFVGRDYDLPNQKSKPEWGINFSRKSIKDLDQYLLQPTLVRMTAN